MRKLAGIALTALKSNFTRLGRPYKLNFAITYSCQSKCITCNIWKIRPTGELTTEEIREFAKKNNYFKWVGLTGGEPFLRGDIVEIVRAFKENCKGLYMLTMPTNSLCNPSAVESRMLQIMQFGIPRVVITVSLDGYRELHDKIRGVTGNFDRAMHIYGMLKGMKKEYPGLDAVFGYTLSKFNKGQFEQTYVEVKKIFPEVTYNDFHINLAQTSENYYANSGDDIRAGSEVAAELQKISAGRRRTLDPMYLVENSFLKNLAKFAETGKSPIRCRSLDASVFVDGWGNVYPSIMWGRKIGNIRDAGYDLAPLLGNGEARKVREEILAGREPAQWTSCESYQILLGRIKDLV